MTSSTPASSANDARDQRVFEAVRQLLAVQGMQLSMDAVAAQAGCSKQTLYSRYGSKRELLQRVMQLHASDTAAPLSVCSERAIRDSLLDFATRYLEYKNQPHVREVSQLIASNAAEFREEAQTIYQGSAESLQSHIAEWMENQVKNQLLDHADPHFMAELLISMISGVDFDRQRFHMPYRDDAQARRHWAAFSVDRFLRAFARPTANNTSPHTNTTRSLS